MARFTRAKVFKKGKYRGVDKRRLRVSGRNRVTWVQKSYSLNKHYYKRVTNLYTHTLDTKKSDVTLGLLNQSDWLVLTTPATAGTYYWSLGINFQLAYMQNASEFQNLYDAYKLDFIKVKIIPLQSNQPQWAFDYANNSGLILHMLDDKDDANAFAADATGVSAMMECHNYKCFNNPVSMKQISKRVVPYVSRPAYQTGVAFAYTPAKSWIDMAYPAVPHNAIKLIFQAFQGGNHIAEWRFRVQLTYYFTCRDVR